MQTREQWQHEYNRLDQLYHQLLDRDLHYRAEKIADRLSEMELIEPEK